MAFKAELAFWAEVASALESAVSISRVEMHQFLCVSSMSADSLQCHFGKKSIRPAGFDTEWPGDVLSQPLR